MPVHRSHDRPYPTAPRADELPDGMPVDARAPNPSDRGTGGRFAPGNSLAAEGGNAKRGKVKLTARLGLAKLPDDASFAPYRRAAVTFRRTQCAELARTCGGGMCGPGPSSIIASASLQLAWSRYLSDQAASTGDAEMALAASRLADASRNNLLSAFELAAKEAKARPAAPVDPLAAWREPAGEPEADRQAEAPAAALLPEMEPT